MQSIVKTVKDYLSSLPEGRRQAISEVRKVILKNLPKGYEEVMNWGMITYQVPLKTCPDTYNKQPLMYAAVASRKNHMAAYLSGIYTSEKSMKRFTAAYKATGKKMDAGKSCVRFKKLEDLPLALIGQSIAEYSVKDFIAVFEKSLAEKKRAI